MSAAPPSPPPHVSPNGKYYWDGSRWLPVLGASPQPVVTVVVSKPASTATLMTIGVVLSFLLVAGCGSSITTAVKASPEATSASNRAAPTIFNVGEPIEFPYNSGGTLLYTVVKVEAPYQPGPTDLNPSKGEWMVVSVALVNNTHETVQVSSILSFDLRDAADGQAYNISIFGPGTAPNGSIAPGDKLAGQLSYDVPLGKTWKLYFAPNEVGGSQAVVNLGTH